MNIYFTHACGKSTLHSKNPTRCEWSLWCLIHTPRRFTKKLGLKPTNTFHLFLSKEIA